MPAAAGGAPPQPPGHPQVTHLDAGRVIDCPGCWPGPALSSKGGGARQPGAAPQALVAPTIGTSVCSGRPCRASRQQRHLQCRLVAVDDQHSWAAAGKPLHPSRPALSAPRQTTQWGIRRRGSQAARSQQQHQPLAQPQSACLACCSLTSQCCGVVRPSSLSPCTGPAHAGTNTLGLVNTGVSRGRLQAGARRCSAVTASNPQRSTC